MPLAKLERIERELSTLNQSLNSAIEALSMASSSGRELGRDVNGALEIAHESFDHLATVIKKIQQNDTIFS